jgi:hypothetical protein
MVILLSMASHVAGIPGICHHTWLWLRWGSWLTFCPVWPWFIILPISICWVARNIGVSHCTWPQNAHIFSVQFEEFWEMHAPT